ncbi:MAG: hypothetical protein SVE93_07560 [Candidatus Thermoplasmatota archaeon]|nr:hypothetical protein [Candidatus Thermoplasmatota archaeon]
MAQDKQVWVNIVLAVVLVCVIVGGVLLYNDLSSFESRVDNLETKSRALDIRLQSLETDVEEMKSESSDGIIIRTISFLMGFLRGLLRSVIDFFMGIINVIRGIFDITTSVTI